MTSKRAFSPRLRSLRFELNLEDERSPAEDFQHSGALESRAGTNGNYKAKGGDRQFRGQGSDPAKKVDGA